MTSTLDRPVKAPTFQGVSLRRKVTNNVATVLVTLSVLIALVPLVWVLYSVISKGIGVVLDATWWTNSQAGMTAFKAGGGVYHAIIGTCCRAWSARSSPSRSAFSSAIYLVEYGGGTRLGQGRPPSWWTS